MKTLALAIIAPAISFSALARDPVYTVDPSQASARLKVVGEGALGAHTAYIFQDGKNCKGMVYVKVNEWIPIRAGEPLTFTAVGATPSGFRQYKMCRVNVTFQPQANRNYLAHTGAQGSMCGYLVEEIAESSVISGSGTPVELALREYKAPFFSSGSWCGPSIE